MKHIIDVKEMYLLLDSINGQKTVWMGRLHNFIIFFFFLEELPSIEVHTKLTEKPNSLMSFFKLPNVSKKSKERL